MTLVKKAHDFAREAHHNQYGRDSKEPFARHVERVADGVVRDYGIYKDNGGRAPLAALTAAALLHDTINNTATTIRDIEREFGIPVAALVAELTVDLKQCLKLGKTEYMARKIPMLCLEALFIQLHDLLDIVSDHIKNPETTKAKEYANQTLNVLMSLSNEDFPDLLNQIRSLCQRILDGKN